MIKLEDLEEAIAECQGQRNPNADTCIKLAAFYTIKRKCLGMVRRLTHPPQIAAILPRLAR